MSTLQKIAMILVIGIALFWIFYPSEQVEKKETPLGVGKVDTLSVDLPKKIVKKDKNTSILNKKPIVFINGDTITIVGEILPLYSDANDEDGNITAYLWREGKKVLGSKSELSLKFSTEGEHNITLMVTDNFGGKTEANISIDVYAQPDKMEYEQHIGCRCKSKTYTYYNSDGNISKIISQTHKDGTDIKKYKYGEDGHLIEEYHLNYSIKGKIFSEFTTVYDEFGNQIEKFGKDVDWGEDNYPIVLRYEKFNYDEKNRLIQNISKENGLVDRIENNIYNNGEGIEKKTIEYYQNEVLSERYEYQTEYDTNGNKIKSTNIESDANGTIHINSREEATYNSENKLLTKQSDDDGDGIIDSSNLYEYNSEGRVTKNQYTNDSKEVTTTFYEYDNNGNKISKKSENSLDENTLTLYSYNEKGERYLTKIDSDGDGNFEEIITNVYNDSGIKIEEKVENDGIIESETFYTDDGKFKERRRNNSLIKYIYDDNGKTMALIQTYFGKEKRIDYIYDDSGKLIQKVDENGKILYNVNFKN